MTGSNAEREQAAIDASAWLARLSGEHVVEEDGLAFEAWLAASPDNKAAYTEALSGWHEFDLRADAVLAARTKTIPAGRLGDPDEFGQLCAYLASAQAGYITGQNFLIDGGTFPGAF